MARNKKNKPLFGGFDRLQGFPLDSSSVYETWAELNAYCSSPIAYPGQIVVCLDKTNDLEHYGAYVMMSITEHDAANRYCIPMKLAGSTEFTNKVNDLYEITSELRDDLSLLEDNDIAQLKTDVADAIKWLNENARDINNNNELLLATKDDITNLSNRITQEIARIFGEEVASIQDIIGKADTINEIATWIHDNEAIISSLTDDHERRITAAQESIERNSGEISNLSEQLTEVLSRIGSLQQSIQAIELYNDKIVANEQAIQTIQNDWKSLEHITEYEFTSIANIGSMVFTPNMRIKTIEIIIDETGENAPNGIYNDNTSLSVELVSVTNPQNVSTTIIDKSEIIILENTKLVFELDVVPAYNAYLRFKAEVSNGMRGHAFVTYYTKTDNVVQASQPEPVEAEGE